MSHDRTYRPVRRVPAFRLQDADGSLRQAPRRSAGYAATHTVQPLKGLPGTRATDVSYRALAPGGAGFCCRICTGTSESQLTAHYSLLTANSTYTFSAKEKDPETGLSYFVSRYYSSDLSVWLSVDPMADKYPSMSSYVYCADNPVRLVDSDGEEVWIIGDDVADALEQLQNQTTHVLSLDEHGKLRYSGEAKSDIDKMIVDAINDEDISVNIISTKSNIVGSENGGAYGGNSYEKGSVCTDQYVCPSMLAAFDESVGDSKPGLTMVHELAESYYGGALALEYGQGSAFGQGDWSTYSEAHWCANQIAIGNRGPVVTRTSLRWNTKYNPSLPISPYNSPIEVGDFEIQTGWVRTTNKYGL